MFNQSTQICLWLCFFCLYALSLLGVYKAIDTSCLSNFTLIFYEYSLLLPVCIPISILWLRLKSIRIRNSDQVTTYFVCGFCYVFSMSVNFHAIRQQCLPDVIQKLNAISVAFPLIIIFSVIVTYLLVYYLEKQWG